MSRGRANRGLVNRGLALRQYRDPSRAGTYGKRPGTTRSEIRALSRLLGDAGESARVVDIPCGNGRLAPFLRSLAPGRLIGIDASPEMLRPAVPLYDATASADASALPMAARSVDMVLCLRLLHHFPKGRDRVAILRELARISRRLVVVSFYNSRSLQGLRRRWRPKRASARHGITLARIRTDLAEAGLTPIRHASLLRFVREQTLVTAHPRVT